MRTLLTFCSLVLLALVRGSVTGPIELEADLEKRDTDAGNTTLKAPIIAVPSEHWEGVDGTWSTFEIRVGTPATVFRVLPVTSWQETWVIWSLAAGYCNVSAGVSPDCADARGGVFDNDTSSTWVNGQEDFLGLDTALGESGEGQYGFDTVGLGYTNETGPTLTHQIVSAIFSDTFWFGILGLGFQPTNFSGYGDPQASFSDTLYSNGSISSMSWSYTAGAYYRLKSVFGQLIFGGYDASRFTPNDIIFTMTQDNLRDIVVTIRSITSTTSSGNTTLMSTPEFAFIDSAVPEIWLPVDVCQAFEKAFGLTVDSASGLYLINDTTHQNLLNMNPNITFTLANQKSGGSTIDIVLPYASFDLNVTSPVLVNKTSYYFPIKSTSDDTLYTLGRTFLQEAYVTTHYESRTFNVSQCIFDDSASPHVLALPPTLPTSTSGGGGNSTVTGSNSGSEHKKLSGGAIAGIVIGALAALIIFGAIIFLFLRRRRTSESERPPGSPVHEIDAGKRVEPAGSTYSAQASAVTSEVDGQEKIEIQGNPIMHPQELPAEVPVMAGRSNEVNGGRNGGMSPIREQKTPMAELGVEEGGLGFPGEREREADEGYIVSPNSDTNPSIMARGRPIRGSPTTSEGTWTPSSPVQRRGSRFEESFDD